MTGARCVRCNERVATVKLIRIVNGEATSIQLCGDCAARISPFLKSKSTLQEVIEEVLERLVQKQGMEAEPEPPGKPTPANPVCPRCGTTFAAYSKRFFLGCPRCYEAFGRLLEPELEKRHGSTRHVGRAPQVARKPPNVEALIAVLSRELAAAVMNEDFLVAASLRDRIRHLKGELDHVFPEVPEV